MFLSHCCPNLKCMCWEPQTDRSEVCLTHGCDGRGHAAGKYWRRSRSRDSTVLMDINQLEEQYHSMRQRQRQQTQVVFRPEMLPDPLSYSSTWIQFIHLYKIHSPPFPAYLDRELDRPNLEGLTASCGSQDRPDNGWFECPDRGRTKKGKEDLTFFTFHHSEECRGENKQARGECLNLPIKTVSVNCTVGKALAFEEDLPFNSIVLDFPNKEYIQGGETPWRTHLDIHRVMLAQNPGAKSLVQKGKESDNQMPQDVSVSIPSSKGGTSHSHNKPNGETTTHLAWKTDDLEKRFHSFNVQNHCIPQINKRFSFPNERSYIWASKNGHLTRVGPIATKGDYYPFPHMKTPRKSATAKSLGLYKC